MHAVLLKPQPQKVKPHACEFTQRLTRPRPRCPYLPSNQTCCLQAWVEKSCSKGTIVGGEHHTQYMCTVVVRHVRVATRRPKADYDHPDVRQLADESVCLNMCYTQMWLRDHSACPGMCGWGPPSPGTHPLHPAPLTLRPHWVSSGHLRAQRSLYGSKRSAAIQLQPARAVERPAHE